MRPARLVAAVAVFAAASAPLSSAQVSIAPPLPPAPGDPAWHEEKREAGVIARSASSGSRTPWGAAEGRIDAPLDAVLEHLLSFEKMPRIVPRLAEVRVLSRGEREACVYFYFDLPWPISDRDYTARYRWERTEGGHVRFLTEDANETCLGPAPGKAVRVNLIRGAWDLAPDGTGTVVRYVALVDYGGSLPRGVVEQTAWKQPLQTLLAIRRTFLPH